MNCKNLIFTGIMLFIAGLLFFSLAFHSIDLGYNCHTFQKTTVQILLDTTPLGYTQTCSDIYIVGIRTLYISMIFFCLSFFILLYPLYALAIDRHLKFNK